MPVLSDGTVVTAWLPTVRPARAIVASAFDLSLVTRAEAARAGAEDAQAAAEAAAAGVGTALAAHLADQVGAHAASATSFVPTPEILSTDTQAAIVEVAATAAAGLVAEAAARAAAITAAIDALLAGAPGALDTLNELAAALGDDANFAATVTTALATKATQTALTAEALLARNADNLTSGTVADARIAATIARDSEVAAAVAALDGRFAIIGPDDPSPGLVSGTEYVWNKTDGAGNLIDIITGVAP